MYEDDIEEDEELIHAMRDSDRATFERKQRTETLQALLRANHFAQTSRQVALAAMTSGKRADYQSKLDENQQKYLKALGRLMPEERVRPSLLEPTAAQLLGCLVSTVGTVGQPGDVDVIISAIEKGVQEEMDEQLRILNEKSIKDKELRSLII